MALIQCLECHREVSDQADACPHCGFPIQNTLEEMPPPRPPGLQLSAETAARIEDELRDTERRAAKLNPSLYDDSSKVERSTDHTREPVGFRQWWKSISTPVQGGLLMLVVAVVVIIAMNGQESQDSAEDSVADTSRTTTVAAVKLEWSIVVGEDTILLTGELPNGFPTETWLNNELLSRDLGGDFSWDLDKQVPQPVSLQDDMGCDQLQGDIDFWLRGVASSLDQGQLDGAARQTAYAQNAIDLQVENGC